jgi:hypothetical protein
MGLIALSRRNRRVAQAEKGIVSPLIFNQK